MFVGLITLLSALSISAVAIYYSVVGLTAIFSAAATAIIIMGVTLELGKLVTVVWLHQNWKTAPKLIKGYLSIALVVLMLITSMGIFGFLSKAHMDQSVPTGDVADKLALIDEKIKTQRDNVDAARTALKQMDSQVEARLSRSDDEKGAERAVQIRRSQAKERAMLQSDIAKAQSEIAKLNEERAPIAKDLRKVEAEVGPIKYIANFFYGDTEQSILEKAVTWVIMILIFVFDPLAIVLLIAAQISLDGRLKFKFNKQERKDELVQTNTPPQDYREEETRTSESVVGTVDEGSGREQPEDNKSSDGDVVVQETTEVEKIVNVETESKDKDLDISGTALDDWNKMIAEAERAAEEEKKLQDEAAQEALKWAQEQEERAQEESKKKEITWFEKEGSNQVKKSRPE